jgi:type VI secretion system VasD/TssJ family lipoprotein
MLRLAAHRLVAGAAVLLLVLFAGCCPKQLLLRSCGTVDRIHIEASEQLNTCDESGAHPVKLYIYSLAAAEQFRAAEFSALFDNDLQVLGEDKLDVVEKTLRPGETLELKIPRDKDAKAIGIVADFCQQSSNCWKRSIDLEKKGARIGIALGKNCMTVTD